MLAQVISFPLGWVIATGGALRALAVPWPRVPCLCGQAAVETAVFGLGGSHQPGGGKAYKAAVAAFAAHLTNRW